MKRVVFCEIQWMKYYSGVSEDDVPLNGGKYTNGNQVNGEYYNFLPYNHNCYGYVMHQGEELHIERYDKALKNQPEVNDVTVVWVASDGSSTKIVGWYEHATMYRGLRSFRDQMIYGDVEMYYNFVAKEENCHLIRESKRTFEVPKASKAGKGRGMGQAKVWYADSDYATEEFVPEVLAYLASAKGDCAPLLFTKESIKRTEEDEGKHSDELLADCYNKYRKQDMLGAIWSANLAVEKYDSFDIRKVRANLLSAIACYDEAEADYKKALQFKKDDVVTMGYLMYTEIILHHEDLAIELGEKIRSHKEEDLDWESTACDLAYLYIGKGENEKAKELMEECEKEEHAGRHQWIQTVRTLVE